MGEAPPISSIKQLRNPIIRGKGGTDSERHLAKLAERSFLNLWSYPNPFRKVASVGDGKELCDLLVVCGRHVIIFSEKNIKWSEDQQAAIAWPRWYTKAVLSPVKQIRGAERWINERPDQIFLDRQCETPFPIQIPPAEERIIHRIVVARGAGTACRRHFNGGSGSFLIRPDVVGDDHWRDGGRGVLPFAIGDIDPAGPFVHVLDDASLDVVMGELDTISDFTNYLERKEKFIRSGRLHQAHGEEDLLAYYAVRINENGDHDFSHPEERPWRNYERIIIDGSHFARLIRNPQYQAKKIADKPSYAWDALIKVFTTQMLAGTTIVPDGDEYDLKKREKGVRLMALEGRYSRRSHGEAIIDAMKVGKGREIFFRYMLAEAHSKSNETAFFFLQVTARKAKSYDEYRQKRSGYAHLYALATLMEYPYLKHVVGIATEPRGETHTSEDLIYAAQASWTDARRAEIRNTCDALGIMQVQRQVKRPYTTPEFPELRDLHDSGRAHVGETPPNRKARRAMKARAKKS